MCRKLFFLIALLGLVSTAWADDLNPPPWRGLPGSTTAQYLYNGFPASGDVSWPLQAPESSSYVSHPEKGDPGNFIDRATDEGWLWEEGVAWNGATWAPYQSGWPVPAQTYIDNFSMQVWAASPTWVPTYSGRTGVLQNFAGSYDIYNFWSMQPYKDIWIQVTWKPQARTGAIVEWEFELEPFGLAPLEWIAAFWEEFAGWGETEGPIGNIVEVWESWWEEGMWMAWGIGWVDYAGWEGDTWFGGADPVYLDDAEFFGGLDPIDEFAIGDGWTQSTFLIAIGPNPTLEFLGVFPADVGTGEGIAIDQVVIDTICYVPEPATIALLGLGGLALIRRKKR